MFQNRHKILENKAFILLLIFAIALIIKIIFRVDYLEDYDAIDFAFGLKDYDLSQYKPHFPGYPIYIFFGRALFKIIKDETLSLITLNIIFGSFCAVMVYMIAEELFNKATAFLSSALFIVNPTISILSDSVNSDICALFFLLLFLYFIVLSEKYAVKRVKYIFFASFSFGIMLGVRVSYAPFLFLWLAYSKFFALFKLRDYKELKLDDNTFISAAAGLLIGIILWLVPLLSVVGISNYYYEGLKFISGHFNGWGGTVVTNSSILTRLHALFWQLFVNGFGIYYYDTSLLRLLPTLFFAGAFFYLLKNLWSGFSKGYSKIFALYVLPYLLWAFFAQNLEKSRHIIPLIPILIIYCSYSILNLKNSAQLLNCSPPLRGGGEGEGESCNNINMSPLAPTLSHEGRGRFFLVVQRSFLKLFDNVKSSAIKYGYAILAVVALFSLIDTVTLLGEHKKNPPPPYSVMKYLSNLPNGSNSILFCGETERFFAYYNPQYLVKRLKTAKEVLDDLDGSINEPENIFVTSLVKGVEALDVKEVATFSRSRYIYNPFNKVTLYKLNRKSVNLLEF